MSNAPIRQTPWLRQVPGVNSTAAAWISSRRGEYLCGGEYLCEVRFRRACKRAGIKIDPSCDEVRIHAQASPRGAWTAEGHYLEGPIFRGVVYWRLRDRLRLHTRGKPWRGNIWIEWRRRADR